MKKLTFLFLAITVFSIVLTSCGKDDDAFTVNQSDIVGTWEATGGDDFIACETGDNKLYVISLTEIQEGQIITDTGCQVANAFVVTLEYEYKSGNSLDTGLGVYKITSFENNTMTFEVSSPLALGATAIVNLVKK